MSYSNLKPLLSVDGPSCLGLTEIGFRPNGKRGQILRKENGLVGLE